MRVTADACRKGYDVASDKAYNAMETSIMTNKKILSVALEAAFPNLELTAERIQAFLNGDGDLEDFVIACVVATNSGKSLDDLFILLDRDLKWRDIAKVVGVDADSLFKAIMDVMAEKGISWEDAKDDDDDD